MQQPGPFEEVAWLAQAAGPIPAVLRYLPPVGIEELDELPLLEEVAAEEIVDALRPRQPVRLAARLVEREEGLEQVHVRVLATRQRQRLTARDVPLAVAVEGAGPRLPHRIVEDIHRRARPHLGRASVRERVSLTV